MLLPLAVPVASPVAVKLDAAVARPLPFNVTAVNVPVLLFTVASVVASEEPLAVPVMSPVNAKLVAAVARPLPFNVTAVNVPVLLFTVARVNAPLAPAWTDPVTSPVTVAAAIATLLYDVTKPLAFTTN